MKTNIKKVEGYNKIADKFSGPKVDKLVQNFYQPRKAISIAALGDKLPVTKKK